MTNRRGRKTYGDDPRERGLHIWQIKSHQGPGDDDTPRCPLCGRKNAACPCTDDLAAIRDDVSRTTKEQPR